MDADANPMHFDFPQFMQCYSGSCGKRNCAVPDRRIIIVSYCHGILSMYAALICAFSILMIFSLDLRLRITKLGNSILTKISFTAQPS